MTTYSALMYNHREDRKRVDVVDLDPYGTAAPFIDAAIQCVHDGGMSPPHSPHHVALTTLQRFALCHLH
jgi:hypothetical protein